MALLGAVVLAGPGAAQEAPAELPPPRIVGPRIGEARDATLRRNGGNAKTEKVVAAALDWLARPQAPGGGRPGPGRHA